MYICMFAFAPVECWIARRRSASRSAATTGVMRTSIRTNNNVRINVYLSLSLYIYICIIAITTMKITVMRTSDFTTLSF